MAAAGVQKPVLAVANQTVSTLRAGNPSTATYSLESDGDIAWSNATGLSVLDQGDWINPRSAAGANYECRATLTVGTVTTGTTGSWLALSSTRSWTKDSGGPPGSATCTFTIEIREVADTARIVSATITLLAESEI